MRPARRRGPTSSRRCGTCAAPRRRPRMVKRSNRSTCHGSMRVSRRGFACGCSVQIEVVAGGESFGDALDLGIEGRESATCGLDQLEGSYLDVALESRLAHDLGVAAECLDVGVLELPEVVFALRPRRAERNRRVGLAVDVRHAPLVAMNDDFARPLQLVRGPQRAGAGQHGARHHQGVQREPARFRGNGGHDLGALLTSLLSRMARG